MALKLRYLEIKKKPWDSEFYPLVEWLRKQNYFEVYNKHFMKSIVNIRNNFAHPSGGFSGVGNKQLVLYPVDVINSVYEDNLLTGKRIKIHRQFHKKLASFSPGLRIRQGNNVYLAFNAWLSFYDNRNSIIKAHLYIQPVYEIKKPYFNNGKFPLSPYRNFMAKDVVIEEQLILLPGHSGEMLEIEPISNDEEKTFFSNWLTEYKRFSAATGDEINRNSFATETFLKYLRTFHKSIQ